MFLQLPPSLHPWPLHTTTPSRASSARAASWARTPSPCRPLASPQRASNRCRWMAARAQWATAAAGPVRTAHSATVSRARTVACVPCPDPDRGSCCRSELMTYHHHHPLVNRLLKKIYLQIFFYFLVCKSFGQTLPISCTPPPELAAQISPLRCCCSEIVSVW